MWLLLAFIAVPLLEIGLFIQVGGFIGLWWTLLIVLITAFVGANLVKSQGAREMANLRGSFNDLRDPTEPLANGAMILFAGALLLTPGFFTDAVGFSLLIPQVRAAAFKYLKSKVNVQSFTMGGAENHQQHPRHRQGPQDRVIDSDFEDVTQTHDTPRGPSGWTKH